MKNDEKKVVTPTTTEVEPKVEPNVEPKVETDVKGGSPETGEVKITKEDGEKFDYVKSRVDRAKDQTQKNVLKDLGVETVEDAKKLIQDGRTALDEVNKLKAKLEAQEQESIANTKRGLLVKLLDSQKVFDSEALANYVDLDKIKVENGAIQDGENVIASLKKAKPNFFGKFETVSDGYIKGSVTPQKTALEKQKEGNTVGAIDSYLKVILK